MVLNGIFARYFEEYTNPNFEGVRFSQQRLCKRNGAHLEQAESNGDMRDAQSKKLALDSSMTRNVIEDIMEISQKEKNYMVLRQIFEFQKIEDKTLLKIYKSAHKSLENVVRRKFSVDEKNGMLIFNLLKLKKRNEEMNKLVVKKAMKSIMNSDKQLQLKQQHTENIMSLRE